MQVAIVPYISSVDGWSRVHPGADIKTVTPISFQDCGTDMTYFAIYYETQNKIRDESGRIYQS